MGEIPQSDALAEAKVDSLGELLSRDPMGFQQQDRAVVIAALREQRVRWEAAEAAQQSKPKASRSVSIKSLVATTNADDLGL